jgi:SOS regulatory protein LexA
MLTTRQKQIKDFVEKIFSQKEIAPTEREIARHFGISPSTAHEHIESLLTRGYLEKMQKRARGIRILKSPTQLMRIPILGTIAAGSPIEAVETTEETITISKNDLRTADRHYALKVEGDSMIDEGIFDGDIVIIREQHTADNGQMIVAIIDDNRATLKKFYKEKDGIRLQPANQNLLPLFRKDIEIRGVVEKIIRNLNNKSEIQETAGTKNISEVHKTTERDSNNIFLSKQYNTNKIYNMNCLDLMKQIKDNTIDLIFADPPYNLSSSNFKMKFIKSGGADLTTNKGNWDRYSDTEFEEFTKKWLSECFRILKKNGSMWVAGTYHNIYLVGYLMKKTGFEILNEVLWHKSDATPNLSCTRFVADHENFIWARKGKGNIFNYDIMKKINGGKQMRSIWTRGKTAGGKKMHPTQKPEWLLERVITATSHPSSIVFDPFIGSGTTAVVAKRYGRTYLGTELDQEYFKGAIQRIKNTQVCNNTI